MNPFSRRTRSTVVLAAATVALGACSGDITEIASPLSSTSLSANTTAGYVRLVKLGPEGTTATFSIEATGGNLPLGSTVTVDACQDSEPCASASLNVWEATDGSDVDVTITELGSTGNVVLERIAVSHSTDGTWSVYPPETSATVTVNNTETALIRFKNIEGEAQPSLRLTKTADNGSVSVGSPMSFRMTVYSDGPATATNVTLTDPLPGGVGIVWSTATAGCSISGSAPTQTLNCAFGDLAAGLERSVTVNGSTSATLSECRVYSNTATADADNHEPIEDSADVTLTDCVPLEFAGCTPGFWKQSQHFQYWTSPYAPSTAFGSVFTNAFPGMTLLQVVGQGGGDIKALGRHAVAALLNSASPDVEYGMSPAGVISAFNAAVASGNYETQKNIFEALNERGCTAKN